MSYARFTNAMDRLKKSYSIDKEKGIGYWWTETGRWFAIKLHS